MVFRHLVCPLGSTVVKHASNRAGMWCFSFSSDNDINRSIKCFGLQDEPAHQVKERILRDALTFAKGRQTRNLASMLSTMHHKYATSPSPRIIRCQTPAFQSQRSTVCITKGKISPSPLRGPEPSAEIRNSTEWSRSSSRPRPV